jgi:hypothetical protein
MMFGIRITEISFDFNHEREYIFAGHYDLKRRNGIVIVKRSTSEME